MTAVVPFDSIVAHVAFETGHEPAALFAADRTQWTSWVRTAAVWLAFDVFGHRAPAIALVSERCRITVWRLIGRGRRLRQSDAEFRKLTDQVAALIRLSLDETATED